MTKREDEANRVAQLALTLLASVSDDGNVPHQGQWMRSRQLCVGDLRIDYFTPRPNRPAGWPSIRYLIIRHEGRKVFEYEWDDDGYEHLTMLRGGEWPVELARYVQIRVV